MVVKEKGNKKERIFARKVGKLQHCRHYQKFRCVRQVVGSFSYEPQHYRELSVEKNRLVV